MKNMILSRAKAFVGALIPAVVFAVLNVAEMQFGFALGDETKITIVSVLTGGMVYQTPNRGV